MGWIFCSSPSMGLHALVWAKIPWNSPFNALWNFLARRALVTRPMGTWIGSAFHDLVLTMSVSFSRTPSFLKIKLCVGVFGSLVILGFRIIWYQGFWFYLYLSFIICVACVFLNSFLIRIFFRLRFSSQFPILCSWCSSYKNKKRGVIFLFLSFFECRIVW